MLHVHSVSYSSAQNLSSLAQRPQSARLQFSTQSRRPRPLVKCPSFTSSSTPNLTATFAHTLSSPPLPTEEETLQSAPTPASLQTSSPSVAMPVPAPALESPSASSSATFPRKRTPKIHPWLIVGIGNPGTKFQKTRHNIGFEMIDVIAQTEGIKLNTIQQKALTGKGFIGPTQVLLAKPQTYVNLTGQSVGPLAAYYRIPVQQILVMYDDTELEFGLMRLQTRGGTTSNNGVKSVIDHLQGCRLFPRLRIGIGRAPGTMDPGAFVLQRFHEPEREEMDELIARVPVLIREMVTEGIEKTASSWNEIRKSRMLLTPEEKEILKRIS
ncbi:hypothetical protein GOP47_0014948 [Adiantum capillus-veneris]|uniref:peptidyl-tRNA hydrolase n=1 Tax=Adiantum capillus-veneris TaxID=13818 RepID=A0A9D4UMF2_ADICA|nr:hypothetical protein GOP47_0014948 [Adiantum capillus-veneris]